MGAIPPCHCDPVRTPALPLHRFPAHHFSSFAVFIAVKAVQNSSHSRSIIGFSMHGPCIYTMLLVFFRWHTGIRSLCEEWCCSQTALPRAECWCWPGKPGTAPVLDVFHRALFLFSMTAEYSLLTVTSYDRYVAICKPCTMGRCWAAELVPPWQQLPGAVGFSMLCYTLPLHFHCHSAEAMLWISSSVKSPRSSSSPAQTSSSEERWLL